VPLRSPVRIYVEKSVAYLENMRSFTAAAKVSRPIAWYIDGGQFFADHNCGPAQEPGSEWIMAPNRP
jgi:hypothetical protein